MPRVLVVHFFFDFIARPMIPVPASAALNSFATLAGTPTFFAKAGLCAAAAIRRAWAGDFEGMVGLDLAVEGAAAGEALDGILAGRIALDVDRVA